jgi:type 2 lantibiotic biosynthesis protein LanM
MAGRTVAPRSWLEFGRITTVYVDAEQFRAMAAAAAPLWDRADRLTLRPDPQAAERRLQLWQAAVAPGYPAGFEARLSWDALDSANAQTLLGKAEWPAGQLLPGWMDTLAAALQAACPGAAADAHRAVKADHPLPFEDIVLPFVRAASRALAARSAAALSRLSDAAQADLERALLIRLDQICLPALQLDFSTYRALHPGQPGRYRTFADSLLAGGLAEFFQDYPVLARLCATVTEFWISSTAEFVEGLAADLPLLRSSFGLGDDVTVTAIQASVSDPHRSGRGVLILTFAAGVRLVYKPRSLGLDLAFAQLLNWIEAHSNLLPLRAPRVLDRGTHGWAEFIEARACDSPAAAQRYYRRSGQLLALVYALRGADLHAENLIAHGEHLVLVDLEMLFQADPGEPYDQPVLGPDPDDLALRRRLGHTVVSTLLLPGWLKAPGGLAWDPSGLGPAAEGPAAVKSAAWTDVNRDEMSLEGYYRPLQTGHNVPRLGEQTLDPALYLDDLMGGFICAYRFLCAHQDDLPLNLFAGQISRFLMRPTELYFAVWRSSLAPRRLHNGAEHSIQLDVLARLFNRFSERPQAWPLVRAEVRALEQGDIPYFSYQVDSTDLCLGGTSTVAGFFQQSGYQAVVERLRGLGEDDLRLQMELIRSAFHSRAARARVEPGAAKEPAQAHASLLAPLAPGRLVETAQQVAASIEQRAIRSGQSMAWTGLVAVHTAQRYQLQMLDFDLYGGTAGIGVFLAALAAVTGEARYRDRALATLRELGAMVRQAQPGASPRLPLGGAVGYGSFIYGLTLASRFLGEPSLLDDARLAARLCTAEQIAGDRELDVISGTAGCLLALLALHSASGDLLALDRAVLCGRHLLQQRTPSSGGWRAWRTLAPIVPPGRLLCGFAHGAAGIAYALLRLYAVTQDQTLQQAAAEAITYEDSTFDTDTGHWPDYRALPGEAGGRLGCMNAWCHGAAGIGLARLGGLPMYDAASVRGAIDAASVATVHSGLAEVDHLCCGNLGRVELLLVAGLQLDRPDLVQLAGQRLAAVVQRAGASQSFRFFGNLPPGVYHPGLFQGASGVGYELLRLAEPSVLPSLPLWL